jgi:phage tail sheath protein FI
VRPARPGLKEELVPEYLSPGVYVEEVDRGPKPIEGVSTSTAGFVGVAERGPEDVPVLVTSFADYRRWYGGYLRAETHPDQWYLPFAVEGFFQNGGQRGYVVRIASSDQQRAARARLEVMDRGGAGGYAARLVRAVATGDRFLVLDAVAAPPAAVQVALGATDDYVTAGAAVANTIRLVALRTPMYDAQGTGAAVNDVALNPTDAGAVTLQGDTPAGANTIRVTGQPPTADWALGNLVQIGAAGPPDVREVTRITAIRVTAAGIDLTLRHTLAFAHAGTDPVERVNVAVNANLTLAQTVSPGDGLLVVDAAAPLPAATVLEIDPGPDAEYHATSALVARELAVPLRAGHAAATVVTLRDFAGAGGDPADQVLATPAAVGDRRITLQNRAALAVGTWIEVGGGTPEYAFVQDLPDDEAGVVVLRQPLEFAHAPADPVLVQADANPPVDTYLVQHASAGSEIVVLADAPAAGYDFVEIGPPGTPGADHAGLTPTAVASVLVGIDPPGAHHAHAAGAAVSERGVLFTLEALDRGEWGNQLRVRANDEDPSAVATTVRAFAAPGAPVTLASSSGVEPGTMLEFVDLTTTLTRVAAAGQRFVEVASRVGLNVGERVRIGRSDSEVVTIADLPAANANRIVVEERLARVHNVGEPVDRMDAAGLSLVGKVASRAGATVTLDAPGVGVALAAGTTVRSREFRLTVEWAKTGDANPRSPAQTRIVTTETYRGLSLDDRHTRYIGKVLGRVGGPLRLWDRRPEGGSTLARVEDALFGTPQIRPTIRVGPDPVYDTVRGRRTPVNRWFTGGGDDAGGVTDNDFVGRDNVDPLQRTGLQSLKSREDVSLVAIPGRTSAALQQELIDHCELMRYRVAVLDSLPGDAAVRTGAQITDVQVQRQQFDSKYAALYYPWLLVRDPDPPTTIAPELVVPPSGHVIGVCARTDITRGVHKAPANEVVRGIVGFQRPISKGEQDVLNPFPMNINVLRDFRERQRGLRVWGARVITSDPEWRYLNVRRLFNYVERSTEIGTQWVVFEDNDYDTWARVRRTISDFLTLVWRNGGLFGATAEEAFYVKCDRTTMSQQEIDAGRLIVEIGISPIKPAEFVILRIGQWTAGSVDET